MQIEHIARVGFTSRRTAKQQGYLTIGPGLLGQIVINDQGILAAVAEVLAHRGASVRSDILQSSRIGSRSGNDDRVVHGAMLSQLTDDVRDRGSLLANSDINADQVLALLVDDRVESDSRLTGLTVANDQLTLTAADRHHGVDGLKTGLNRLINRLTFNNARGDLFDHVVGLRIDRALAVNRLTQGVDHTANQLRADGNLKNTTRRTDGIAFRNMGVFTENNRADGVTLQVHCQAIGIARELQHFALHHVGKTMNTDNAVGNGNHGALRTKIGRDPKVFDPLLQQITDFTRIELHYSAPEFMR